MALQISAKSDLCGNRVRPDARLGELSNPYAQRDKIIATCPRLLIQPDPRIAALVSILGAKLRGIWRIERNEA